MVKKDSQYFLDKVHAFISEGAIHCPDKHARCEEDDQYAAGEQWRKGDLERQAMRERPAVPWNSVLKAVNLIANREIVERFQPKVYGRSGQDKGVANVLDELVRWQRDVAESEHIESQAVRAMVTSGYGVCHKLWDETKWGGEGLVSDEDVPIWEMLWPAAARQTNLADRRWHVRGKFYPRAKAEALFGDINKGTKRYFKDLSKKRDIWKQNQRVNNTLVTTRTASYGFLWGDIANGNWINEAEDSVFVVEAEWIDYETSYRAAIPVRYEEVRAFLAGELPAIQYGVNEATGEPSQLDMATYQQLSPTEQDNFIYELLAETTLIVFDDKKQLDYFISEFKSVTGMDFGDWHKVNKEVVMFALITDDQLWDCGERPYGFTYEFLTGWRTETRSKIDFFGVVDVVKGPQDYKNALLSNMLSLYMTSPKQLFLIEDDAVPNFEELETSLSRPVGIGRVPPGFLQSGKFRDFQPPQFPPMMPMLIQLASQGVEEALNLNSIDNGTQGDLRRISGTVVQAAKMSSNMNVANLFDSIRQFRKRYTALNLRFFQEHFDLERVARIVGDEKRPEVEILKASESSWRDTMRFDVKVDEEPVSPTERMELLEKLSRTGSMDTWLEKKWIDFESALDLMPHIPESIKRQIVERNSQYAQMQQEFDAQLGQVKAQLDGAISEIAVLNGVIQMTPIAAEIKNTIEVQKAMAMQIHSAEQKQQQTPAPNGGGGRP